MNAFMPEDILTPEELSTRLKLPLSWIYEKSRKGGSHKNPLPVLRCGRYLRFSWPDVCEWLSASQNRSQDEKHRGFGEPDATITYRQVTAKPKKEKSLR